MSSENHEVRQNKKKRKTNSSESLKRGKDHGNVLSKSLPSIVFPKATAIVSGYLESLRSFQLTTFQQWFDEFTSDDFTFFMMRLQENTASPISVYKEITGKASACNFTYIRMMSVPDGVFSLKIKGIYPSITDPDALCMIVCDYSCTATRLFETEAIEDKDDPNTEEGETVDQQQSDLELAVASLHKMARFKEQNQMPLDDGVFDDSSLSSSQPPPNVMSRDQEHFINDSAVVAKENTISTDNAINDVHKQDILVEINDHSERHDDINDDNSPYEDDSCSYHTPTPSHSPAIFATTSATQPNSNNSNSTIPAGPNLVIPSSSFPAENNIPAESPSSLLSTSTSISYQTLSSINRSYTSTEPGVYPFENRTSIIKTFFTQKQVRLVDRMPIFIAKPGATFRLGERLPNGGIPFHLNSKMEFYVNKEEKVYKLRHVMHA